MNKEIQKIIASIYGKKCCRVSVGNSKSLSLGFGAKLYHNNPRLKDTFYGEWELGTYFGNWRIVKNSKIQLGSGDEADIISNKIKDIKFQEISAIENLSDHDVRVKFSDGLAIDFLPVVDLSLAASQLSCCSFIR